MAGHRRPHAGPPPGADGVTGAGPKDDAFAALLGIDVERRRPGHTVATLTTTEHHANPHGAVHGAVFYAVVGAALAAAANDEEHSGIVTSVLVEYLRPAAIGDVLRAEVVREVSTGARGHLHRDRAPGRRRRSGPGAGLGACPGYPQVPAEREEPAAARVSFGYRYG